MLKYSISNESILDVLKNSFVGRWLSSPKRFIIPVSKGLFGGIFDFEPVKEDGNYTIINSFPIGWFKKLVKKQYGSTRLVHMFECTGIRLWGYRSTIRVHKFFLPELTYILSQGNGGRANHKLIDRIVATTWLKDLYVDESYFANEADLTRVERDMKVQLFDWQTEFIKLYDIKRQRAHMNGELLSFGCGLGKTITSLALMKALDCDAVVIIAPKSTLEDVWVDHLTRFFKKKQSYFLVNKTAPKDASYFIFNYESMDKIDQVMPYIKRHNKVGIIVDESHNFLKMKSLRTQNLISLRTELNCHHCLLQSGTPLRALGTEVIPLLHVIDGFFDAEAEDIFRQAFGLNTEFGADILHARMNLMMHRRQMEDVFTLPEKHESTLNIKIKDGNQYTIKNVQKELSVYMEERLNYHLKHFREYQDTWNNAMMWLADVKTIGSTKDWQRYQQITDYLIHNGYNYLDPWCKTETVWANAYEKNVLEPALPKTLRDQFRECKAAIKYLDLKIQGEVLGRLDQIRARMVVGLLNGIDYDDLITSSLKKVIFFTTYVTSVEALGKILDAKGYKHIDVYGKTSKDAPSLLDKFRKSNDVQVLIATMQTLATGVTLVEANTAIFLNDPWRDADKEQASNRIWRIGQDTPCDVITVHLDTGSTKNLSDRTTDILEWSKNLTDQIVNGKTKTK